MFNTEERPRFNLYQKKLMNEPLPTFGQAIGQDQEEVVVDETPKETVVDVKEQKPQVDKNKFLGGIFDERPKAPVYDTTSEQQNQAMMKAQAIGNLLSLVGDVGGVAAGANVARREMKPLEPYMAAIQRKREQFEAEKKAFDKNDWLTRLKEAEMKSAQDYRDKKDQIEQGRYDTSQEQYKNEWEHKLEREKEADSRWWANYANSNDAEKERRRLEWAKLQSKDNAAKFKANEKDIEMNVDIGGKEIPLREGEAGKYLEEALKWIKTAEDRDVKDMDYMFKNQPQVYNEQLVRRYLMRTSESDPDFKKFLLQKNDPDGINDYNEYKMKNRSDSKVAVDNWVNANRTPFDKPENSINKPNTNKSVKGGLY